MGGRLIHGVDLYTANKNWRLEKTQNSLLFHQPPKELTQKPQALNKILSRYLIFKNQISSCFPLTSPVNEIFLTSNSPTSKICSYFFLSFGNYKFKRFVWKPRNQNHRVRIQHCHTDKAQKKKSFSLFSILNKKSLLVLPLWHVLSIFLNFMYFTASCLYKKKNVFNTLPFACQA